ncbi:hypothetical protein SLEP1_g36711 [Rubroshorea leprosula]|uniref:NB-ARC domain-containing protein n=1 Tax=Rubroshorea leprosula TaxID=152421 RepID=A0AAV5KSB1_9ROSI|nr:hypothetical protein SLEP1_g36711 [Rubroshorea leprosula]
MDIEQEIKRNDEKESVKRYTEDFYSSRTEALQNWLEITSNFIQRAHYLLEDVGKRGKSLFQLRKKAEQICKDIAAHVQEARGFSDIPLSYRQEKVAADRFEDFESRSGVLKDIMEALRSPGINKIGVHGKPGMGKTMMVREVKRRAEQERLFDAVLMATVGRNPDLPRIQDEIARVSNEETGLIEKKVLVILDDLWKPELSLELLGINGKEEDNVVSYKLLLTSRDRDVVSHISETQIEIGSLAWGDEWNLFKKIADDPDKSRGLPFYANEITKKCEGLPIAVATLANALRRRNLIEWKTTLRKLQSPPFDQLNSSQIPQSLYSAIKLHYSGLKSNELHQIFLLCSLLGQNATIQNLLKYGIGLGLFPGVKSLEEARAQVLNLVTKLKDSSLLLDSGSSLNFDMHDLVRDFATSTVSKEYGVLALTEDAPINWSHMEAMESIKWIYLSNGDTSQLPDELKCPKLTFFHLSEKSPSLVSPPNLFRDKEGLKVLSLSKMNFLSIPSLISPPKNLRTLCLDQVELGAANIGTMMGELENLQQLQEIRVKHCSDMEEIIDDKEQESGNSAEEREGHIVELITLRSLKLQRLPKLISFNSSCRNMAFFNEKVVFSNLEELQLFSIMVDNTIWYDSMTSCIEKLTKLIIHGCDNLEYLFPSSIATGLLKLRHLQVKKCQRMREIIVANGDEEKEILIFPQLTFLVIEDLQNLVCFCAGNYTVEFSSLKQLQILNCINFEEFIKYFTSTNVTYDTPSLLKEKVVLSNLEELWLFSIMVDNTIWYNSMTSCIKKLTKLIIHGCDNLEYLFSSSMAADLLKLRHLQTLKTLSASMQEIILWNAHL